ncbi:MAG TPA: hypothetical protein VI612_04815 [Candidatus Nanoarchaeia archaeon]|nr:hypothetical protein [Candidatus Nanoarchaeia archaeon]
MPEESLSLGPPVPPAPAKRLPSLPEMAPSSEQLNTIMARVRVSEERYGELRKKLLLVEQNMLGNHKKAMSEIKSLQAEINEVKRTMLAVEDRIITVIKEIRLTARKEDVDVLKRYLELWDPVKFITSEQVEKIIDEKLGRHKNEVDEPPPRYDSP